MVVSNAFSGAFWPDRLTDSLLRVIAIAVIVP